MGIASSIGDVARWLRDGHNYWHKGLSSVVDYDNDDKIVFPAEIERSAFSNFFSRAFCAITGIATGLFATILIASVHNAEAVVTIPEYINALSKPKNQDADPNSNQEPKKIQKTPYLTQFLRQILGFPGTLIGAALLSVKVAVYVAIGAVGIGVGIFLATIGGLMTAGQTAWCIMGFFYGAKRWDSFSDFLHEAVIDFDEDYPIPPEVVFFFTIPIILIISPVLVPMLVIWIAKDHLSNFIRGIGESLDYILGSNLAQNDTRPDYEKRHGEWLAKNLGRFVGVLISPAAAVVALFVMGVKRSGDRAKLMFYRMNPLFDRDDVVQKNKAKPRQGFKDYFKTNTLRDIIADGLGLVIGNFAGMVAGGLFRVVFESFFDVFKVEHLVSNLFLKKQEPLETGIERSRASNVFGSMIGVVGAAVALPVVLPYAIVRGLLTPTSRLWGLILSPIVHVYKNWLIKPLFRVGQETMRLGSPESNPVRLYSNLIAIVTFGFGKSAYKAGTGHTEMVYKEKEDAFVAQISNANKDKNAEHLEEDLREAYQCFNAVNQQIDENGKLPDVANKDDASPVSMATSRPVTYLRKIKNSAEKTITLGESRSIPKEILSLLLHDYNRYVTTEAGSAKPTLSDYLETNRPKQFFRDLNDKGPNGEGVNEFKQVVDQLKSQATKAKN